MHVATQKSPAPAGLFGGRFFYFGVAAEAELEGGLTAGPLLLPGNPGTLVAS